MRYVLIVADGDIALHFVHKVLDDYSSNNFYIVLYRDSRFLPKKYPNTFRFHECDYTSSFRLESCLDNDDVSDIFIVLQDEKEGDVVYDYLRKKYKKSRIVRSIHAPEISYETTKKNDGNLIVVAETNAVASRLLLRMPNVPVIPRGFGLEQGEIMEIGVPSGSIFAYRQIDTIKQVGWCIVGIYRASKFILATQDLVISPGDILLVAGEPQKTRMIYNQIKADIGQFPAPFGRDICLILDMRLQPKTTMLHDCKEAIYVHRHLKSAKLTIKILHATEFEIIKELEELRDEDIAVVVDYENLDFIQTLKNKISGKVGFIIVSQEIFAKRAYRKALWASRLPVLKIGSHSLRPDNYDHTLSKQQLYAQKKMLYPPNVATSLLVSLGDEYRDSNISTLVFDISKQLCLDVSVYDFEPDGHFNNEIDEEFENLSRIFERKYTIKHNNTDNPIFYIQGLDKPILHFIPFRMAITRSRLTAYMRTQFESIVCMDNANPQLFIPVSE
ncbi:MAG: hypothetical protein MR025_09700 [Helicobacter trogontum]|uniref:TrkA C-terminal domain-containing protein n=1 Tax=Helicobacter trogontum TaxID=50960 RepID=UPI0024302790|nr:TrkA C-terminal domain-containing protein [Helicobacter trogontum]MCI5787690.1 hypothetical protein [Helicobacter trogontum]